MHQLQLSIRLCAPCSRHFLVHLVCTFYRIVRVVTNERYNRRHIPFVNPSSPSYPVSCRHVIRSPFLLSASVNESIITAFPPSASFAPSRSALFSLRLSRSLPHCMRPSCRQHTVRYYMSHSVTHVVGVHDHWSFIHLHSVSFAELRPSLHRSVCHA